MLYLDVILFLDNFFFLKTIAIAAELHAGHLLNYLG